MCVTALTCNRIMTGLSIYGQRRYSFKNNLKNELNWNKLEYLKFLNWNIPLSPKQASV